MNRKLALTAALVALLAVSVSKAQANRDGGAENVTYDYAQVLRVEPIYEIVRTERQVVAYDVEYQYKGEKYMSRLPYDPGNRLRIRVSVMPEQH